MVFRLLSVWLSPLKHRFGMLPQTFGSRLLTYPVTNENSPFYVEDGPTLLIERRAEIFD